MVLRWILGKVDICQTDYSIHSKLRIVHYSEAIRESTRKMINYYSTMINFHFPRADVPDNTYHEQKWRALFFTRIKLVARVLACVRAIARIKWKGLLYFKYDKIEVSLVQICSV